MYQCGGEVNLIFTYEFLTHSLTTVKRQSTFMGQAVIIENIHINMFHRKTNVSNEFLYTPSTHALRSVKGPRHSSGG
jgi:hypothetical protein